MSDTTTPVPPAPVPDPVPPPPSPEPVPTPPPVAPWPDPAPAPVPPPAPPPPPPPLDLGPFAACTVPDPALRQTLFAIGVQISVLMMNSKLTPEDVAAKLSLPVKLVYQMMVGIEPTVGLGVLNELATMFGGRLIVQLAVPQPAPA